MSVKYKDYYKLLGVERGSSKDEIGKAYKKLARKYHPDLNPNNKEAENKFKDINEAYEVLKDDEKRRLYDQLGPDWEHGQQFRGAPGFEGFNFGQGGTYNFSSGGGGSGAFSDFFEMIFGNMGQGGSFSQAGSAFGADPFAGFSTRGMGAQRGGDIETNITLNLEDAYRGGKKSITLQGSGGDSRSLEVNIPRGVKPGARIRLAGQGRPGLSGGPAGDLYLKVEISPHPQYRLEGSNIVYTLSLAPWEAALGSKVRVPTLDGEVELNIKPGTGSGRRLRLRDRGLGSGANRGDQLVLIEIAVPEQLSPAEEALWRELAAKSNFRARA
ncbi:MAG: DnaJ domain-containing protein [Desulfovibrionaceae bacterium]|nr:DnaJ domain-containing protein [Desulfovibrionaceae bacterium]